VLDRLTIDDFRPIIGRSFALDLDGDGTLELDLTEARTIEPDAPPTGPDGHRTPFALLFRGPAEPLLPQRTYRLEQETVGALEIFIVPVACSDAGADYEAIFT
jgi:hypothetical protein